MFLPHSLFPGLSTLAVGEHGAVYFARPTGGGHLDGPAVETR